MKNKKKSGEKTQNKPIENIFDVQYLIGGKIIEITQGMNGYPKDLYKVITNIGNNFNNYEKAIELLEEKGVNAEIIYISRKDGQQLWTNNNLAYKPYDLFSVYDNDCNYCVCDKEMFNFNENKQIILDAIEEFNDSDDIQKVAEYFNKFCKKIYKIKKDEFIVHTGFKIEGEFKKEVVNFYFDSTFYDLAIKINF